MLGSLAFAAPWLLLGLLALPLLWWLLRAVPPAPRLIPFPAIRLLFGLKETEETPHRTPWWLLALRLFLAALLIVGLAHPLLNPGAPLERNGPLILVVDDSWSAAANWAEALAMTEDLIAQAERQVKPVIVLTTASGGLGAGADPGSRMRAADARRLVQAMAPRPWPADYENATQALDRLALDDEANIYWLAGGLAERPGAERPADAPDAVADFARGLVSFGPVHLVRPPAHELPVVLTNPLIRPGAVVVEGIRADTAGSSHHIVNAMGDDGRVVAQAELIFESGTDRAQAVMELPTELRNSIARFAIEGQQTAAAILLVDEQFRRRPVGLVSGGTTEQDQPFLGDRYYLGRALAPFAEMREGGILELLARDLAVLVTADVGRLTEDEISTVSSWLDTGGILVRFAGPRLAESGDALLPVRLRQGGRTFGGVMSWAEPIGMAPFDEASPFAGLAIPDDVLITRQVLAEPSLELAAKTWARATDGTPLVTAERRGRGWLVLIHTTANATWSNLALSGLYVNMLRRILALSQGVAEVAGDVPLAPYSVLDGFGRFSEPPANATAIVASEISAAIPGPQTPPGYYGTELSRRALNLGPALGGIEPLLGRTGAQMPDGIVAETYARAREVDLKPWLLTAALILLLADYIIALVLRGLMPRFTPRGPRQAARGGAAALVVALAVLGVPGSAGQVNGQALSANPEQFAIDAAGAFRLAYMRTGIASGDEISEAGLRGLGSVLNARTSIEPAEPVGLDAEHDELAFFSIIYWRIDPAQGDLSDAALERINQFLRHGGMILFDTADQQFGSGSVSPGVERLRSLVGSLDIPPLQPVPPNHVLTRAFYLLQDFPGRWTGGDLWVQRPDEHVNDGVSPVIVGSNDYASAWALDSIGRPLYPVSPGGERQREMAMRVGVNLVMYALTGNYKADQVHVPAILERLGQ